MADPQSQRSQQPPAWRGWALFAAALVATFVLGMLGASILTRREEAKQRLPLQPIGAWEMDAAKFGENYPREYETYRQMLESSRLTKYGGDKQRDYLEQTPANVILFAGYGFAKDYRQARGHVYTIEDVTKTPRVTEKTPATCLTCKSSDVPRLMAEFADPENPSIDKLAPEKFYAKKFSELKDQVTHPIGCSDCHDPATMQLRITRPALREALKRQGRDVDQLTHQEMRSMVCAQCHVTYYFKTVFNYLTFPWDKGMTPEKIEEYFEENQGADFENAISKTKMLKMRHPDYELYRTGVHAYRDIACADCHMPYRTEGGVKFTNHHLQSPLFDIANSCAVCHRWGEEEIRRRVETIQDKVHEDRQRAETGLARAHLDIAAAMQAGADEEELASPRKLVRGSQLRWDYIAASNGMGFHSPQEAMRILAASIDMAGQARLETARVLARHGVTTVIEYPDYSTKAKAQSLMDLFIKGNPPKLVPEGK